MHQVDKIELLVSNSESCIGGALCRGKYLWPKVFPLDVHGPAYATGVISVCFPDVTHSGGTAMTQLCPDPLP